MKPTVALLISVLTCAVNAAAQVPLTLDEAIARGVAASHRVAESTSRREAADAVVAQRQAAQRPTVNAAAGYTRTNHVDEFGLLLPNNQFRVIYPDVPDNYQTRLGANWSIYTGGRLQMSEAAAARERQAAARDTEALKGDVRLEITRAFWSLYLANESLRVITESLTRVDAHVANVRNALAAGLVPPNEVLTAEAQEARQRMLSAQATSARDIASAELARLVGAPLGTTFVLSPVFTPCDCLTRPLDALTSEAVAQRPERRALLDRTAAAEQRVAIANAGRRPTVSVGGGIDYARPNPRIFPREAAWKTSWDVGVNVSWPLFDGGKSRAEAAEAAAGKRAIDARVAEFDSVVSVEIRRRQSEFESSVAALAAADASLQAATEALRVVNERYAAGVAISSDVLDAQLLVLQASLDRTQAIVGQELAGAGLKRAIGQ